MDLLDRLARRRVMEADEAPDVRRKIIHLTTSLALAPRYGWYRGGAGV
jgi:hypothetical protein